MEASVDPQPRGPDWMPITPKAGSLFHADSHFDVVLRFDREKSDGAWSFRQLFPQLLSGDSRTSVDQGPE
jgi:hypothetical protein